MCNGYGYRFFVAVNGGIRLEVRTDKEEVKKDVQALGKGARIIPLVHKQAQPLIEADLQHRYTPAAFA